MRTYWLSFTDPDRPKGDQFLGVVVVDVTEEDAEAQLERLRRRFPHAKPGAEWVAAAMQRAWVTGCNPGGEIATTEITGHPEADVAPRDRLMRWTELKQRGLIARPS